MRTAGFSLLIATSAFAAEPTVVITGARGDAKTLAIADLKKLPARDLNVPEPHGKDTVVVPTDKRAGRWVRQVLRIKVLE